MKVYQVCVMDEWSNVSEIGYYKSLEDKNLIDNINSYFKEEMVYDEEKDIYIENFKIKPGDLQEYASTFGSCFDREYIFESGNYIRIFGFIYDLNSLIKALEELK